MYKKISELLISEGLTVFAPIGLESCTVKKKYLLEKAGIECGTAVMIAAPYYTRHCEGASISAYAVSRDYHLFYKELFARILPALQNEFPGNRFAGFADHSPIDEIEAAAKAGLGFIGKNGMLITEKYSSFVFIGELIFDASIKIAPNQIKSCEGCDACTRACPMKNGRACLSAVTQKKGELTPDEIEYIREYGSAWGCDICQNVCPHTKRAKAAGTIFSEIPFFNENPISHPSVNDIVAMSDGEFFSRAFSWRGRDCILRNLKLIGEAENRTEG